MSNYYGYVSVDALMEFAHNHVNGMIDSNDIARFPKANVKDANEQQSLQEIFGIPFARLRELAEAERDGRAVVLNELFTSPRGDHGFIYADDTTGKVKEGDVSQWPDWKKRAAMCNYELGKED